MITEINPERVLFKRSPLIYGQFLEHFHRQIYGGVYMPGHPLADADGFRTDVIDALRRIRVPVIRWPGGCYVSAYHWKNGVGQRVPAYDKAWRVEETNEFGTDEFVKLCRKIGCEPYICTNAGSGTEEEMSDWVEYCNLDGMGQYARQRAANGSPAPYNIRYWSVGNENYYDGEIGRKTPAEWGRFVNESAKMMKRVDPGIELSAAAIADIDWNTTLLREAGARLSRISIHGYWDELWQVNSPADYNMCMARTAGLDRDVRKVRGLIDAFGLSGKIKIAYDEWNLRGWHHPGVDTFANGDTTYIAMRDKNDINATYTMADAVFSACFLNMLLRNSDIVDMANFAPIVNTRGAIYTYDGGIVLRPTFYVFEMYTRLMGEDVVDVWTREVPREVFTDRFGNKKEVELVDVCAAKAEDGCLTVSLINKHPDTAQQVTIRLPRVPRNISVTALEGDAPDAYNDVGVTRAVARTADELVTARGEKEITFTLPPHSVSVAHLGD